MCLKIAQKSRPCTIKVEVLGEISLGLLRLKHRFLYSHVREDISVDRKAERLQKIPFRVSKLVSLRVRVVQDGLPIRLRSEVEILKIVTVGEWEKKSVSPLMCYLQCNPRVH